MDKFEIASALRETGLLLSVAGGNPYKARAYLNGARSVESVQQDIGTLIEEERLTDIPGIGPSLAASIVELYREGSSKVLQQLKEELPPGIIELSSVPGLTLMRVQALHKELGVSSIAELEAACHDGLVRTVKGFGVKLENSILAGIKAYKTRLEKILLVDGRRIASQLQLHIAGAAMGSNIEVVGDIRRWHEAVDTVQLVVDRAHAKSAVASFKNFALVTHVEEESEKFVKARLTEGILAELHVAENMPAKLIETTGSVAHFQHLQRIAEGHGLKLDGEGLFKDGLLVDLNSEESLYRNIGLNFIPPELREDLGEIDEAKDSDFSDLITIEDIKGMTHCHTTFSDGRDSVEEMARAAESMGMEYLTITDHSPLAHYAGGVTVDELKKQWEEIDRVQESVNIRLLKGTECDILADGKLDYPDAILEKFDVIIASVHSRFKLDRGKMTKRLLNCMRNKNFKIWGHPLGRLVLRREPIDCDVEKVLEAIAESNAAVEINSDPHRLDLEPRWARCARQLGIKFIISTDAHATGDYRNLKYGVHQARRAGLRKADVLNALSFREFKNAVKPRP